MSPVCSGSLILTLWHQTVMSLQSSYGSDQSMQLEQA